MASIYISEYSQQGADSLSRQVQAPQEPSLDQKITVSGTSAQSAAFNATTRLVRIATDVACHLAFGDSYITI